MLLTELLTNTGLNLELFTKLSDKFFLRLMVDLISIFVLVRLVYYRNYKKSDLFLTFFGFNILIFLVAYLLNRVDMTMGAAFGLFAVFSMLRFRTEGIDTKDMTYLFLAIGMGLLTAVGKGNWGILALVNLLIVSITWLFEGSGLIKKERYQLINYDNLELIKPENKELLLADIKNRTGINAHKVELKTIDLITDAAKIHVYYYQLNG